MPTPASTQPPELSPTPAESPTSPPSPTPQPAPTPGPTPVAAPAGWQLAWHDEFDGPSIDPANWTHDLGAGGWGNSEFQNYTDRPENARIENGMLVIEARKEPYQGSMYTSARLKSQGLQEFQYGRMEARLKVPAAQGMWPAFWMLGNDIEEKGWPACGEVDIMEYMSREPNLIFGTAHGPGYSGGQGITKRVTQPEPIANDFHTFAIEWGPEKIDWFYDGAKYHTVTRADVGDHEWVFDHPFFLILNMAVGGTLGGWIIQNDALPAQYQVDYVRVFQPASS